MLWKAANGLLAVIFLHCCFTVLLVLAYDDSIQYVHIGKNSHAFQHEPFTSHGNESGTHLI